ncbi:acyltransferase family protein [Bacillus sp. NEB1478]|uniref:acyltransferase family protein n=1 Tax=Bacillus sp. NEB1478 TaxID=3073816 RepID=UPI0028737C3E|nr:acyltransferase family protein [Bacillus sp. NEB1478]WNB91717.1 acyltransferase family protein [Bacillus sp. NEB1478]
MENHDIFLKRQYDMDWIRVLATVGVFLYHCSMFVNPFPWHVKNNEIDSSSILVFSLFVGAWIMPIFFAVSGVSVSYAFEKRSVSLYLKERLKRLGVPLLFGVLFLTPPQIYMERVANNQFNGSYFEFFPHFFDGIYLDFGGTGNFAFFGLHLWYLLVLVVFSFLTIPLFKGITKKGEFRLIHYCLLPIFLFASGLIKTQGLGGWDLMFYLLVFIYGYYFFSSEAFKQTFKSTFRFNLVLAFISSVIYINWFMKAYPQQGSEQEILFFAVRTINCWSLLLCIFFLADKYLSFSNDFHKYASEASMPFYILHQPIILCLGFMIRNLAWPISLKLLFLIPISFLIIMLCYHFVIQKFSILRFLFGMKGKRVRVEKEVVQPAL